MSVYKIDPLRDPRWRELVNRHPFGCVFHSPAWLEALHRTYRYEQVVFTTSSPTCPLVNGLAVCLVRSWLTGGRMVSLPFSDHCQPLFDSDPEFRFLIDYLQAGLEHQKWMYLELRPAHGNFFANGADQGFRAATRYVLHKMNIRPDLDEVFHGLDRNSVQRRIRRAERAGLVEKCGTSEHLLQEFYRLLVLTRRRHRVPPPPLSWFRNLVSCFGNALDIRVAYQGKTAIASVLTLRFRDTMVYKYGCSDKDYHHLGAMPLLLWRSVQQAKAEGANEVDLGRSDEGNLDLVNFKDHWTKSSTPLTYWRFPGPANLATRQARMLRLAKGVFAGMPDSLLRTTGKLIYRHIG